MWSLPPRLTVCGASLRRECRGLRAEAVRQGAHCESHCAGAQDAGDADFGHGAAGAARQPARRSEAEFLAARENTREGATEIAFGGRRKSDLGLHRPWLDRKSTRLNSSHLVIS